ncbi:MAG: phosphatidate cytidylyltransferase, partial [Hyphomicrobiales bacterium]|nr:phosphatidate cytidylyltransferase [Hyphomicrobiales bacterium]
MVAELAAAWPVPLLVVLGAIWGVLAAATVATTVAAPRLPNAGKELASRTRTWWLIVVPVSLALLLGATAVAILFALVSFLALREYLSIIPVRQVDRTAILLAYIAIPLQYW